MVMCGKPTTFSTIIVNSYYSHILVIRIFIAYLPLYALLVGLSSAAGNQAYLVGCILVADMLAFEPLPQKIS